MVFISVVDFVGVVSVVFGGCIVVELDGVMVVAVVVDDVVSVGVVCVVIEIVEVLVVVGG